MFNDTNKPPVVPVSSGDRSQGPEIFTMPEQFVIKRQGTDKTFFFLILGGSILVLTLLITGVILLFQSAKDSPPIDPGKNTLPPVVSPPLEEPSSPMAPPSEEPILVPPPVPPPLPSSTLPLPSAQDSDNDGLTDLEEELFGTNPTKQDTDGDSYLDGSELTNLYNPREAGSKKIADSGLVLVFSSPRGGWSLLYPSPWLARPLGEDENNIIITASTGEFVEISEQVNQGRLSLKSWYQTQAPSTDLSILTESSTSSGFDLLLAPDGLTRYLAKKGSDLVYLISYNIGTRTELNFGAIVTMMTESFSQK